MVFFSLLTGLVDPTSKAIYTEIGEKIQKLTRILNIVFPKVSPVLVTIPPFLASLITSLTTDLATDALELPLPMW